MNRPQPRVRSRILCTLLLLLLGLSWVPHPEVEAQSETVTWSKPRNLSQTPYNSDHPAIIADSFGYVHTFWSEDLDGEPFQPDQDPKPGSTILYTRWDGVSWTAPKDVLYVPDDLLASFVAVDIDSENRLHVVWAGLKNHYYANAPSWEANYAAAWSRPMAIATSSAQTRWESSIAAAPSGSLHIAYATGGSDAAVYHIRSDDGGLTWQTAVKLTQPLGRLEKNFSNVQIIADEAGRLHAVWETNQQEGFGQAVYYARSTNGGNSWSLPVQMGYRDAGEFEASYPFLAVIGESEIHMIYVDGPWHTGRWHRISRDGGETWSEPRHVITGMEGVNGYVFPLVDGEGGMHLIINMRTIDQVGGIFYSPWLGNDWGPVARIPLADQEGGAHWTAGATRLGNELHVVWTQLGRGEIGHVSGTLPWISPLPPSPIPSTEPEDLASSSPTPVNSAPPALASTSDRETATAVSLSSSPSSPALLDPIVIGAVASLLVVGGVVLWAGIRRR
jgi:hypothetical protein